MMLPQNSEVSLYCLPGTPGFFQLHCDNNESSFAEHRSPYRLQGGREAKIFGRGTQSNLLRQIPSFLKLTPVRGIYTEQPTFSSVPKWNYLLIILALHCKCWKIFFKKDKKKKNEVPISRNLAGTEHIERKKAS